ncbi:MAG: HAD family hydrolase [Elusimicrobia bacterium]|nr:HAD family hydrolase [Elusimicrobiota bacterium]
MKKEKKAIFLDRDGTLIKDTHYLNHPNQIQIYKGVIPALKKIKKAGWRIIIGTNQSAIGRGILSVEMLQKIHKILVGIFKKSGVKIDEIFFCPHHPKENCICRKPNLGMLLKGAKKYQLDLKKCIVVGDNKCDILWGKNGGTKTILVLTGKGKKTLADSKVKPDHISPTLKTAAKWILEQ